MAKPILNLDEFDELCEEILSKTSSLLSQDYCSLVTFFKDTHNTRISDYMEAYTELMHPIDWDLIEKVRKEKITYMKTVNKKDKLQDWARFQVDRDK